MPRAPPFLTKSADYREFCHLCDRLELKTKEDFPKAGNNSDTARAIDQWISKKSYGRTAVKKKFNQYLASKEARALDREERFVQEDEIPRANELIETVQQHDAVKRFFPTAEKKRIFTNPEFLFIVVELRQKSIQNVNKALSDTLKTTTNDRARAYHVMKKEAHETFCHGFVNIEVEWLQDTTVRNAYSAVLFHQLIHVIHAGFRNRNCPTFLAVMDGVFHNINLQDTAAVLSPLTQLQAESLYYVAGWAASAVHKKSKRSAETSPIKKWISNITITVQPPIRASSSRCGYGLSRAINSTDVN